MQKLTDNIYVLVTLAMVGTFLLVVSFVFIYARNQKRLIQQKERAHKAALDHQKALLNAVIQSQEKERERIGQDLHDEVGGSLSNLRILINRFENSEAEEYKDPPYQLYKQLIDKIIQDVRNISHSLSPPGLTLFGFSEALEEIKDVVGAGNESFISITNHAEAATENLPHHIALALLRVLQELVTNTLKHANAKKIGISLFMKGDLLAIHYTDDGIGYTPSDKKTKKGMGTQNIESRLNMINARYTVKTAPDKGFSMFICFKEEIPRGSD